MIVTDGMLKSVLAAKLQQPTHKRELLRYLFMSLALAQQKIKTSTAYSSIAYI